MILCIRAFTYENAKEEEAFCITKLKSHIIYFLALFTSENTCILASPKNILFILHFHFKNIQYITFFILPFIPLKYSIKLIVTTQWQLNLTNSSQCYNCYPNAH